MVRVKHRPLTAHDDRQLPEDSGRKIALITGDFLMSPAPTQYHQTLRPHPFTLLESFLKANSVGKHDADPLRRHAHRPQRLPARSLLFLPIALPRASGNPRLTHRHHRREIAVNLQALRLALFGVKLRRKHPTAGNRATKLPSIIALGQDE